VKTLNLSFLVAAGLIAADLQRGLPARSQPDDYAAKAETGKLVVAATVMDPNQVRNEFSTSLNRYQVLEVALYPAKGSTVDVSLLDFAVRVDGRLIRPAAPRAIAGQNQKRAKDGQRDISVWPSVGVSTGSWGTGTNVGVGVGVGGNTPGPGSTDRDRRTMEMELDDRGLQEGIADKPVAGYLYFPVGETRATKMELVYQQDTGEVTIPLTVPRKK
jgi:hypothetical protein